MKEYSEKEKGRRMFRQDQEEETGKKTLSHIIFQKESLKKKRKQFCKTMLSLTLCAVISCTFPAEQSLAKSSLIDAAKPAVILLGDDPVKETESRMDESDPAETVSEVEQTGGEELQTEEITIRESEAGESEGKETETETEVGEPEGEETGEEETETGEFLTTESETESEEPGTTDTGSEETAASEAEIESEESGTTETETESAEPGTSENETGEEEGSEGQTEEESSFFDKEDKVEALKAASVGKGKVALTWKAVKNAEGYFIYTQKNGIFSFLGKTQECTYLDTDALETDYNFYFVCAYCHDEEGLTVRSAFAPYVYAKGVCAAVTNVTINSTSQYCFLSWAASEDAEGYLIYGIREGYSYKYLGMTSRTCFADRYASSASYNFYWIFPYYYNEEGKMISGIPSAYKYGRRQAVGLNEVYFPFANFSWRIPSSVYQWTYKDKAEYYQGKYPGLGDGGCCFGFAAAEMLMWAAGNHVSGETFFKEARTPADLSLTCQSESLGISLKEFIGGLQITQPSDIILNQSDFYRSYKSSDQAAKIQAIQSELEKGNPVLVCVYGDGKGHALCAYRIEIVNDTSARIYVSDSNWPGNERSILLTGSDYVYTEWEYEVWTGTFWGSSYNKPRFAYVTLDYLSQAWTSICSGSLQAAPVSVLCIASGNAWIRDCDGRVLASVIDGEVTVYTEEISQLPFASLSGCQYLELKEGKVSVQIESADGKAVTASLTGGEQTVTMCCPSMVLSVE